MPKDHEQAMDEEDDSPGCFLSCFSLLRGVTIIACVVSAVVASVAIYLTHIPDPFQSLADARLTVAVALRICGLLMSLTVILAELGWSRLMAAMPFMDYWPFKGCFIIYVALQQEGSCLQSEELAISGFGLSVCSVVASVALLLCGVCYLVSGLLCLRFILEWKVDTENVRRQELQVMNIKAKEGAGVQCDGDETQKTKSEYGAV